MRITITVKHVKDKLRATGAGVVAARRQVTIPFPNVQVGMRHYNAARELERKLEASNDWYLRLVHVNNYEMVLVTDFVYEVFDQTVRPFNNTETMQRILYT